MIPIPKLSMIQALQRRREAVLSSKELMFGFESMGDNCEFGIAQRFSDAEALGLLRFNWSPMGDLIDAVETEFQHYGADGDLSISTNESGICICRSYRYGFSYKVSDQAALPNESLLRREYNKVRYLKQRLIGDLATGEKIFVRKKNEADGRAQVDRLVRAMGRYGSATLMWVRLAEPDQPSGSVRALAERLIEGRLSRFAPYDDANNIDLAGWLELCRNAHGLVHGVKRVRSAGSLRNLLALQSRHLVAAHHLVTIRAPAQQVFGINQSTVSIRTGEIHTFSAWIKIPSKFKGSRISAVIGHWQLMWRDPDLTKRDCWQLIWLSAKIPAHIKSVTIGIVVVAEAGDRILSRDWRLEADPTPSVPGSGINRVRTRYDVA